jgi:hypothetical protein
LLQKLKWLNGNTCEEKRKHAQIIVARHEIASWRAFG